MDISSLIINWYEKNKRDLPWRKHSQPYHIWVSEVILQQTRVDQGLPYFMRFTEKFPTVYDLANASEDEVLNLWKGLGYYSRASNMLFTAKNIVENNNGQFPKSYNELIKLKGIGDYIASAIASICYNEAVAVLDGNVLRVLSRFYGVRSFTNTSKGKKEFKEIANHILNNTIPGTHNQAIMEFGALQCTPKNPKCNTCPLSNSCYAPANNKINELPSKQRKNPPKPRHFAYILLQSDDFLATTKRTKDDIWKGLYEFPLIEMKNNYELSDILNSIHWKSLLHNNTFKILNESIEYKHQLSHQTIYAKFYHIELVQINPKCNEKLNWINKKDLDKIPFPRIISRYMEGKYFKSTILMLDVT